MRIIRTDTQKENLAKYCWDLSKIVVAALVIAPFAKPESVNPGAVIIGLLSGIMLALAGYILDGMRIES